MEKFKELKNQLDRIEKATIIGTKKVLNIDEVALLTGFKKATLYGLTCHNQIPYAKKGGRLFFGKEDIEEWLMADRVATETEIQRRASKYLLKRRFS